MNRTPALLIYAFIFTLLCVMLFILRPAAADNTAAASVFLMALYMVTAALKGEK